ncbi:ArsB/NhaD family transporter [Propionispira raffinosivorans]|uniref:SLC13 family permease n=1 Tax=Propionispira raffinosivorans TaxID=86959 RepID=UPI000376984E|nr:SLC13 family permease [Propionispira raffinosivorans]
MTQIEMNFSAAVILGGVLLVFTLGKSPFFRIDRAGVAIIGAVAMMGLGIISFDDAVKTVDYRTIVILFSMMVLVANLKIAGFFEFIGQHVLENVHSKKLLLLVVILLSGVLSALAINDIICLLLTPVIIFICNKGNCDPLPHLMGLALASNIGSAATFLGNPQNILIGSLSKLTFMEYFKVAIPIVCIGLLLTYLFLAMAYNKKLQGKLDHSSFQAPYVNTYLIGKTVLTLFFVIGSYIAGYDIVLTTSLGAAFLLITRKVKPNKVYTSIDFNLLVIFIGLFVIVGGVKASGLLLQVQTWLPMEQMNNLGFFAVISVVLSNLVSNVPAVLLLQYYIPVDNAAQKWQALALFSTFAGNLTIFGSIANLIVVEIAKKNQIIITAKEYFRVGFPLTVILTFLCVLWLNFLAK